MKWCCNCCSGCCTCNCCYSKFCRGVTGVIVVALVLVGAVVGILYTSFTYEESLHLTRGDTRRISSYSSFFCEKLRLENTGMPNNLETSLFIFPNFEIDELSKSNVFNTSIAGLSLPSYQYQYWKVFLHPGSTVTLKACVLSGTGTTFRIWNGDFNERWTTVRQRTYEIDHCNEGPVKSYSFFLRDHDREGMYYFLLEGQDTYDRMNVLNGTLYFEIPEYDTENVESVHVKSCTIDREYAHPCTVSIPLYPGSYAVISAEKTSLGLDSTIAAVDVKLSCEPRVWVYAAIAALPGVIAAPVCCIVLCVYCYMKNRRYSQLDSTPPTEEGQELAAAAVVAASPGSLTFHS